MAARALPRQADDFPGWYGEVVRRAGLAENAAARGAMVIKPYGYAIWERIRDALDERIRATGHQNAYFPLLLPYRLLEQEAEHVEGFTPEVALVTHAGGRKLEEPLAIRPTSEAIIWSTFSRWVQSYRDLPLLINQWANVVRWEMRPRLFLRTTEFLWQEGHTAHESGEEALAEALLILRDVYREVAEDVMAMPVLQGRKSAAERFPGAVETYTIEALMRDGKALQAGTSHYLGQNFARAYDVRFSDRDGERRLAYATSWGASTRLVGGLIMAHGDDRGLRLPPALAPFQLVIVPITRSGDDGAVPEAAARLAGELRGAGVRVEVDARPGVRPGFKFNEWELRGVPLRLELGARDLEAAAAPLHRRDTGAREQVGLGRPAQAVTEALAAVQATLRRQAEAFRDEHTLAPSSYAELRDYLAGAGGFARAPWCGRAVCEEQVKAEARASIRVLGLEPEPVDGSCIVCGRPAAELATWAQAY